MGFPLGSVKHFSLTHDIRNLLVFADIVLYGSSRQEPVFPPLLSRSMASEIPIIVPNLTVITKYVCLFIQSMSCYLFCQCLNDSSMFNNISLFSDH